MKKCIVFLVFIGSVVTWAFAADEATIAVSADLIEATMSGIDGTVNVDVEYQQNLSLIRHLGVSSISVARLTPSEPLVYDLGLLVGPTFYLSPEGIGGFHAKGRIGFVYSGSGDHNIVPPSTALAFDVLVGWNFLFPLHESRAIVATLDGGVGYYGAYDLGLVPKWNIRVGYAW